MWYPLLGGGIDPRFRVGLKPYAPSIGPQPWDPYMSYSLNSLEGGYIGDYIGDYYIGVIKGDTRSLDYSSYGCCIIICTLKGPWNSWNPYNRTKGLY